MAGGLHLIPSFTAGTLANVATDVFAGDWSQVLVGVRGRHRNPRVVRKVCRNWLRRRHGVRPLRRGDCKATRACLFPLPQWCGVTRRWFALLRKLGFIDEDKYCASGVVIDGVHFALEGQAPVARPGNRFKPYDE